ncbi:MAG: very short patch repair endonuclease, partial [Planctomycetota bacterium]|nr:very short patch repair endonuclease [Planctomycetota bacterium]
SALHREGFRFRLNVRALPGCPDIVLPRHKMVIFVHGCFWHRHIGCDKSSLPRRNREWWVAKLRRNRARDRSAQAALAALGWKVVVVWECELPAPRQELGPAECSHIARKVLRRGGVAGS